jgi:small-conductance mechanosensitive channel
MKLFGVFGVAELLYVLFGVLVFIAFVIGARVAAHRAGKALRVRGLRNDMVVIGTRVITVMVIGFGAFIAFSLAIHSDNLTLAGIVIATIIASFGVQDVLKDYVSGYYVLLERHIRLGDYISLETGEGTVVEVKLRVTLLRNETGHTVVVPNSELFNRPVTIRARPAVPPAEPGGSGSGEARPEPPG